MLFNLLFVVFANGENGVQAVPSIAAWSEESTKLLRDDVKNCSEKRRWILEIDSIANRFGNRPEVVEVLVSILKDSNERGNVKSVSIVLLGTLGGAVARDGLIRFIETPMPDLVPVEDFEPVEWAIKNLGEIGDADSIAFLTKLASKKYWSDRTDQPVAERYKTAVLAGRYREATVNRLRECALLGISCMGTQKSLELLYKLKNGDCADMNPTLIQNVINDAKWRISGMTPQGGPEVVD